MALLSTCVIFSRPNDIRWFLTYSPLCITAACRPQSYHFYVAYIKSIVARLSVFSLRRLYRRLFVPTNSWFIFSSAEIHSCFRYRWSSQGQRPGTAVGGVIYTTVNHGGLSHDQCKEKAIIMGKGTKYRVRGRPHKRSSIQLKYLPKTKHGSRYNH